MKLIRKSLGIKESQKNLRQLQRRLCSDATCTKILRLYYGEEGYMNEMGVYPYENFYDLRLALHFRNTQELERAIRTSAKFGVITCSDDGRTLAFFSPLWYDGPTSLTHCEWEQQHRHLTILDQIETVENPFGACKDTSKMPSICSNGYNNILSTTKEKEDNISTDALLKRFFERLFASDEQKQSVLGDAAARLKKQGGLDDVQTEEALAYFCSHQLTTYFKDRERQLSRHKYEGWITWLRGLLRHRYATQLLTLALQEYSDLLKRRLAEQRQQQRARRETDLRAYHPVSPYEWTNRETGQRCYDDPIEGVVEIPSDAAARPTPGCTWHILRNVWFEGGKTL